MKVIEVTNRFLVGFEACSTGRNSCLVVSINMVKSPCLGGYRPWHGGGQVSTTVTLLKRQVVKLLLNIYFFTHKLCCSQPWPETSSGQRSTENLSDSQNANNKWPLSSQFCVNLVGLQGLENMVGDGAERVEDGRRPVTCCLLNMTRPLHSWAHCSCGDLHKIKSTRSVNIPAGSNNWAQWVKTKQQESKDIKGGVETCW